MRLRQLVLPLTTTLLCACAERPPKPAGPAIRTQVSREIARICALPDVQRQQEIDQAKRESGVTVVCPNP
jgi:hypothetical protein